MEKQNRVVCECFILLLYWLIDRIMMIRSEE